MVAARAAALLATLIGLASLLVGCGGGGGDTPSPSAPTPAPTKPPAPTPASTPSPTTPPAESWAKAACTWSENKTLTMYEVGCDDKNKQLRIEAVTITTNKDDLGSDTCEEACTKFLASVCTEGKANQTTCSCNTQRDNLTLEDTQVCDAKAKEKTAQHKTTTPETQKYVAGHDDCQFSLDAWIQGTENGHPQSCKHLTDDESEIGKSAASLLV